MIGLNVVTPQKNKKKSKISSASLDTKASIYADYNGSAPLCAPVKKHLLERLQSDHPVFANPNANHHPGRSLRVNIANSRNILAQFLESKMSQIIFNSGASEGVATAFHSILHPLISSNQKSSQKIILGPIEHSAVLNTAQNYADKFGFEVCFLSLNKNGEIDLQELRNLIDQDHQNIALVSVMAANNETGVIQPYEEIGEICQQFEIPFFSDTTQLIGKTHFNFEKSQMDFAIVSGHKMGALTGCGALLAKNPDTVLPLIFGGGQEQGLRGGTQHYLGIETMGIAAAYSLSKLEHLATLGEKRNAFEQKLKEYFPSLYIFGEYAPRLATTSNIALAGTEGKETQRLLEKQKIFVTTSSACSDQSSRISRVLSQHKVQEDVAKAAVRISLGPCASGDEYDIIFDGLIKAYRSQRINSSH